MVLTRVEMPLAYGIVIADETGRILRFLEKPTWGEVFSDTINTGIYLLESGVFDAIPTGRPCDFGKELFPALLAAGRSLWGHVAPGYWRDVGDLGEYRAAHLDLLQGRIGVEIPGARNEGAGSGPAGDLIAWLRGAKPSCHILFAIRVVDSNDLLQTIKKAQSAAQLMDGCGLFCYRPAGSRYEPLEVPLELEMDRAVTRICERLRALP